MAKQFKKKKGSQKKKQLQSNFPAKKETSVIKDGVISYEEGITVGELAEKLGHEVHGTLIRPKSPLQKHK